MLTDSDKQGATSNLSSKQTSNMSTEQASNLSAKQASNMSAKQAAVEAVVNSVLSEALSNVASVHKPPAVEMVITKVFFIPLRVKQVGEFIAIRHKKISPTRILSTLGCLYLFRY